MMVGSHVDCYAEQALLPPDEDIASNHLLPKHAGDAFNHLLLLKACTQGLSGN